MSNCACFNLRKSARRVSQAYDWALRPTGLRVTQFSLLSHLKNHPSIPISVLAEDLELDRTTLSRNLGPLREGGLLKLRPGRDARVQEVSITEAGRRRHEEALPHWRDIQQRVADLMGADTLTRLLGGLEKIRTVVSATEVSSAGDSTAKDSTAKDSTTEVSIGEVQVKRIQVQRIQVQRIQVKRFPDEK